jgi:hypothetical protein
MVYACEYFYILLLSLKSEIIAQKLLRSKATILFQNKLYSAYPSLSLTPCFVIAFPFVHTIGIRNYINCPNLAVRISFVHARSNVCDVSTPLVSKAIVSNLTPKHSPAANG